MLATPGPVLTPEGPSLSLPLPLSHPYHLWVGNSVGNSDVSAHILTPEVVAPLERAAAERRENNLKHFKDFDLKPKALTVACVPYSCLTEKVCEGVLQKSIPPQIRQLILYHYQYKKIVAGFVRELTFTKRLHDHFL